jgi:hypothetical protein
MNASANIFEVLADIDSKFAKFTEKESDGISVEVRKWFKKLAVSDLIQMYHLASLFTYESRRRRRLTTKG